MWDPFGGVGGRTASLYGQYSSTYNRVRVFGSKINVEVTPLTADNTAYAGANTSLARLVRVDLCPARTSSGVFASIGDTENLGMLPYGTSKENQLQSSAGGRPVRISRYMSVRKLFGLAKSAVQGHVEGFDTGVQETPAANHEFLWLIRISQPYVDVGPALVYRIRVWMTFYAEFFERKIPMPFAPGNVI